jgi:hypothetical protein
MILKTQVLFKSKDTSNLKTPNEDFAQEVKGVSPEWE